MFRKVLYALGYFHVVMAITCMLIGVIVEFHQVHVYKNNISFWQLQATKTVSKDTKKYVQPITSFVKQLNTGITDTDPHAYGDSFSLHLCQRTIYSRNLFDLITPEYMYDKVLRGPPRA